MKSAGTKKQFNLSHVKIDEKLQGARLASFSRRSIAYAADWMIIAACTQFIWLVIPLLFLLWIITTKYKTGYIKSRRIVKKSILNLGRTLEENTTIEPALKRRFTKGMVFYVYALLYVPVAGAFLYLIFVSLQYFSPEHYKLIAQETGSFFSIVTKPVFDLADATSLLAKFFGAFVYFSVFTWKWNGQTPGKRLLKITVVKLNGSRITFWNSLERASGYTASAAILFLGFVQYFWDRNAQTTHDKITETIVIEV